jgi:hypothetical protein
LADWSTRHDSERFEPKLGTNLAGFVAVNYTNGWFHAQERIGVPVAAGVDDVALALTMDAYSRTGRSRALAVAEDAGPFVTRSGLTFLPDLVDHGATPPARMLAPLPTEPQPRPFDHVLDAIGVDYGRHTAEGVGYDFEYPR